MKTYGKTTALVAMATLAAALMGSCEMEYYEEELYRKEISLVSGENNIIGQEFEYGGDEGQLALYASGTTGLDENVTVTLELDREAIGEYNRRNYDTQFDSYAMQVPAENFTIDPMTLEMEAGSCTAFCPVRVNTDGLLPDQTYFIPLRIASVSSCMASTSKNFVLFEIYRKNAYATTKTTTYYTMNGTTQEGWLVDSFFGSNSKRQAINSSKPVLPLDARSIRMLPAAKASSDKTEMRACSIRVTVDPETWINVPVYEEGVLTDRVQPMQRVTLAPYLDSQEAVSVRMSSKEVSAYDPATETFHLHYYYQLPGESRWYEVHETMTRTQY